MLRSIRHVKTHRVNLQITRKLGSQASFYGVK